MQNKRLCITVQSMYASFEDCSVSKENFHRPSSTCVQHLWMMSDTFGTFLAPANKEASKAAKHASAALACWWWKGPSPHVHVFSQPARAVAIHRGTCGAGSAGQLRFSSMDTCTRTTLPSSQRPRHLLQVSPFSVRHHFHSIL